LNDSWNLVSACRGATSRLIVGASS
jgi:hypothetical protein